MIVHWFELLFANLINSKGSEKKKRSCLSPVEMVAINSLVENYFLWLVWEELQKRKNWKCRDGLVGCNGSSDSRLRMKRCLLLLLLKETVVYLFCCLFLWWKIFFLTVFCSSWFPSPFLLQSWQNFHRGMNSRCVLRLHTKHVRLKLYTLHWFKVNCPTDMQRADKCVLSA